MYRFILGFASALLLTSTFAASTVAQVGGVFGVESVTKTTSGRAVDFTWKDGSSTKSFSAVTKGKVVLLNIWATWCGPCKREIPDLIALSQEMAPRGVMFVGVSVDQHEKRLMMVKNYVEKVGVTYINIVDDNPPKIAEAYGGIRAIPTTMIIDRNGNVVERLVGMRSKAEFKAAIERAL
jgi:thiol-disulfide isomerase/thioredoxin